MDKRFVFLLVFLFTLFCTVLVAVVSLLTEQTLLTTVIYSFATMWVTGILSQLVFKHLYLGIVKPMEDSKQGEKLKEERRKELNVAEIERIDQVVKPKKTAEVPSEVKQKPVAAATKVDLS